jgi:hypothetical protein
MRHWTSTGLTVGAGACNEDLYGVASPTPHRVALWVLDGCTSLSRRSVPTEEGPLTDAAYFVRRFSACLQAAAANAALGAASVAGALDALAGDVHLEQFRRSGVDVPSASFLGVEVSAGQAWVYSLGDCRLLVRFDNGPVEAYGTSPVAALDARLLDEFEAARRRVAGRCRAAAWEAVVPTIRRHREKMNQHDGYPILESSGAGLPSADVHERRFEHRCEGVLLSDGLYRLVDVYGAFDDEQFFREATAAGGLVRLAHLLRQLERDDPQGERWARVKLADDATGLHFCWHEHAP